MTAIEKFTFSLSFDDADNVIRSAGKEDEHYELSTKKKKKKEEEAPPPPPPVYTEEQGAQMVADAEKRGHEQGFAEGHKQGFDEAHQQIMASLEKAVGDVESEIAEKLAQIDEQQKRANAKINEDAIHVALGVIRKLAPAWSKQYQMTEIEDIVRQCLANLFEAPKVMIKVNPELETEVGAAAQRIADSRGFSGKVVVVGEPDVAMGDCQVSWGDGTAVRDSARIWSEINAIIDNALTLHATDHDLPESDMGDPEVQESRLAPEAKVPAQPSAPVQPSGPAPDQAETVNQITPEMPSAEEPAEPGSDTQEGDGTAARNMQTLQEDTKAESATTDGAMHGPETDTTPSPQPTPEPNITDQAENKPEPQKDQTTATAQGPAQPGNSGPETEKTAAQEDPTTTADETAAVKQPTKDAGDENG
ncbi:FliH/SctL family protein [Thalassospira sp. UBA1131]|uniref:FliH/SctL family protein n=1 Tax=Thalassospira sp. UBA1131 TaxID=1947672 RepID=UPI0025EBF953|nr:FliH/SctL family protein [Thalassospira sp. UBA1131]